MNYLQLCRRAITECGVASNAALNTVLPTVVGASGSVGRVVNWVNDAWTDVEMEHSDWGWMRSSSLLGAGVSFQTVDGQASYPLGTGPGTVGIPPDSFSNWDIGTFRNHTTSVGFTNENYLDPITFDAWRNGYAYGAQRLVRTRPIAIAVGPDRSLCLGPFPNGDYTITGDYYVAPSDMVSDTDVPIGLPLEFHMLIVYGAMIKYGQYESAQEVYSRGQEEFAGMYARLQLLRAPLVHFGGALA